MNSYRDYIEQCNSLLSAADAIPLGNAEAPARPHVNPDAPCVLVFAPHPDDESIIGALPLRLLKESGYRVVNVAVTLGSLKERRDGRKKELQNACEYLGFELVHPLETGLGNINPTAREDATGDWLNAVLHIKRIINRYAPSVIMLPHNNDWNSAHIGTHHLVMDALRESETNQCFLVETEFWHPMEHPAIMVESSIEDVAELVTAISFHIKEVQRNPYHLALPAWMHDNVRRGSEHLGGQGGDAPAFAFATLYGLKHWQDGSVSPAAVCNPFISAQQNINELFQ